MEANRKESCDFKAMFRGEEWHIRSVYIQSDGKVAWYDGNTCRDGVRVYRTFSGDEIAPPDITPAVEKLMEVEG
jgi:hypothetical protein